MQDLATFQLKNKSHFTSNKLGIHAIPCTRDSFQFGTPTAYSMYILQVRLLFSFQSRSLCSCFYTFVCNINTFLVALFSNVAFVSLHHSCSKFSVNALCVRQEEKVGGKIHNSIPITCQSRNEMLCKYTLHTGYTLFLTVVWLLQKSPVDVWTTIETQQGLLLWPLGLFVAGCSHFVISKKGIHPY